MKQINLLPQEAYEKQALHKLLSVVGLAVVMGMLAVGGLWYGTQSVRKEIADLRQHQEQDHADQIARESGTLPSVKTQSNLQDQINRVTQLNSLSKTEINWQRAFNKINSFIPHDIHLSNYSVATATGSLTIKLSGQAASNLSFANFAESIKASPVLTTPKIEAYNYSPAAGTVNFSLSGLIPLSQVDYSSTH